MRSFLIAGNWKMNASPSEGAEKARIIQQKLSGKNLHNTLLICPSFITIPAVQGELHHASVKVGAQNVSEQEDGAYTGEVSTGMLKDAGCEYVITGHSERREYYHETSELIARKTKKVLESGLKPILCVGEKLESRKTGDQEKIVADQMKPVFDTIPSHLARNMVIAYEPVWAIGTGETATPEQAQEMHASIRKMISDSWGDEIATSIQILYGGSMKPANAEELLSQPDVDGGLIGGASLQPESFLEILEIAESLV